MSQTIRWLNTALSGKNFFFPKVLKHSTKTQSMQTEREPPLFHHMPSLTLSCSQIQQVEAALLMELHLFPVNKPNYWSCYITTTQRGFLMTAAEQAQSKKGDDFSHMRLQLCSKSSTQSSCQALETHQSRRALQSACTGPLQRSSPAAWGRLLSLHSSSCWQEQLAACCSHSGPGFSPGKAEPFGDKTSGKCYWR